MGKFPQTNLAGPLTKSICNSLSLINFLKRNPSLSFLCSRMRVSKPPRRCRAHRCWAFSTFSVQVSTLFSVFQHVFGVISCVWCLQHDACSNSPESKPLAWMHQRGKFQLQIYPHFQYYQCQIPVDFWDAALQMGLFLGISSQGLCLSFSLSDKSVATCAFIASFQHFVYVAFPHVSLTL